MKSPSSVSLIAILLTTVVVVIAAVFASTVTATGDSKLRRRRRNVIEIDTATTATSTTTTVAPQPNEPNPSKLTQNVTFQSNESELCAYFWSLANSPGYVTPGKSDDTVLPTAVDAIDYVVECLESIPLANYATWNVSAAAFNRTIDHLNALKLDCTEQPPPSTSTSTLESSTSSLLLGGRPFEFHPFLPSMEGPIAEPLTHHIAYTNAKTRVVAWHLPVAYRELFHTHGLASIMWFTWPAGTYYYDSTGEHVGTQAPTQPDYSTPLQVVMAAPEWLHSVENRDDHTFYVLRVMFVPRGPTTYHWPSSQQLEPPQ